MPIPAQAAISPRLPIVEYASTFLPLLCPTPSAPQIVDGTNLKVHDVVAGSQVGRLMTAHQGTKFGPGQTYYAFATFAAPPSGATLSVKAADGAPPFTDVTAP